MQDVSLHPFNKRQELSARLARLKSERRDWDDVVSVKLWVLVRGECPETGYSDTRTYILGDIANYAPADSFRRNLYSTIVALRN